MRASKWVKSQRASTLANLLGMHSSGVANILSHRLLATGNINTTTVFNPNQLGREVKKVLIDKATGD